MAEQFCVAALRHLDTAELLEREGKLDDAGYHYGLAGETAVKHAVATACSFFPSDLRTHFNHRSKPLTEAILDSQAVTVVLENGRLGGGLARDLELRQFASRFDKWHINIRYADTDYPVNEALVAAWKADAVALLAGVVL